MKEFTYNKIKWDFFSNGWWSRVYEYKWLRDVLISYFKNTNNKSVLDVGTGNTQPGIFILKDTGFNKVIGTDIFSINSYKYNELLNLNMQYIKDNIVRPSIKEKFDAVCCISVLEHFPVKWHEPAIKNIIDFVKPQGCIVLTFDIRNFDYKSIVELYTNKLLLNNFELEHETVDMSQIVTSVNSICRTVGRIRRRNLSCYRIFAYRK